MALSRKKEQRHAACGTWPLSPNTTHQSRSGVGDVMSDYVVRSNRECKSLYGVVILDSKSYRYEVGFRVYAYFVQDRGPPHVEDAKASQDLETVQPRRLKLVQHYLASSW